MSSSLNINSQTIMAALFEPDLGTRTLAVPFERSIEEWPISSMDSVQSIELYKKYSGIYIYIYTLYTHIIIYPCIYITNYIIYSCTDKPIKESIIIRASAKSWALDKESRWASPQSQRLETLIRFMSWISYKLMGFILEISRSLFHSRNGHS